MPFPRSVRALARGLGLTLVLAPSRPVLGQRPRAAIVGHLVDSQSHSPIGSAQILLLGTERHATSDPEGRFIQDSLRSGAYTVEVHAVGYRATSWHVDIAEGEVVKRDFELEPLPVRLDSVLVERGLTLGEAQRQGFERRRMAGRGYFITEQEIRRMDPRRLADLLRDVPGVLLICRGLASCTIRMARSPVECKPDFVVDGFPATASTSLEMSVAGFTGIEIYRTLSETPLQFLKGSNMCGTVVIWTRAGR